MSLFYLELDWEGFEKDKYVHTVLEDNVLPKYLLNCRWFAGKNREKWRVKVFNSYRLEDSPKAYFFVILQILYKEGDQEFYLLPVSFMADNTHKLKGTEILTAAKLNNVTGVLVDACFDPDFRKCILSSVQLESKTTQLKNDVLVFSKGKAFDTEINLESVLPEIDSSNTAIIYENKYFFKLYRKLFDDTNPEVEMLQFITQNSDFNQIPRFAGSINLEKNEGPNLTFGLLVEIIKNNKDNWSKTGDYLNDFIFSFLDGNFQVKENVFEKVALLGYRTAQMHDSLFSISGDENFRAEPFDRPYRRFIHQKVENLLNNRYALLTDNYLNLDEEAQHLAWRFMDAQDLVLDFVDQVLTKGFRSYRTRVHGDFHLGQVLVQDQDLIIIDFEGEPESKIADRKIKHSPLKDVAGMIRSYHYAVSAKLFNSPETNKLETKVLHRAADRWYKLMRDTYLEEYLSYFGPGHQLLFDTNEINYLLQFHLLEKAVYELGYELNYRPSWVKIPLKGIIDVLTEIEKIGR